MPQIELLINLNKRLKWIPLLGLAHPFTFERVHIRRLGDFRSQFLEQQRNSSGSKEKKKSPLVYTKMQGRQRMLTRQRSAQVINGIPSPLTEPGRVFVFGNGDTGQLGLGDGMLARKKPMPLLALDDEKICDIVCGAMHTVALTNSGRVRMAMSLSLSLF